MKIEGWANVKWKDSLMMERCPSVYKLSCWTEPLQTRSCVILRRGASYTALALKDPADDRLF